MPIKEIIEVNGALRTKRKIFEHAEIKDVSAERKEEIVSTVLKEEDQINLLAVIVEQIGDSIGLDTPEYNYAKVEFAKIKTILGT